MQQPVDERYNCEVMRARGSCCFACSAAESAPAEHGLDGLRRVRVGVCNCVVCVGLNFALLLRAVSEIVLLLGNVQDYRG